MEAGQCDTRPANNSGRRHVVPAHVATYVPGGRWGPRRVRVSECAAVLKAEDILYSAAAARCANGDPGYNGNDRFPVRKSRSEGELGDPTELRLAGRPCVPTLSEMRSPLHRAVPATRRYLAGAPSLLGPDVRVAEPSQLQGHALRARAIRPDVGGNAARTRIPGNAGTTGGAPRALPPAVCGAAQVLPECRCVLGA